MVKTSKLPKAQENAPVEVAFGFSFASDWSRGKGDLVHVKKYVIERLVMRGKKSSNLHWQIFKNSQGYSRFIFRGMDFLRKNLNIFFHLDRPPSHLVAIIN